MKKYIKNGIVGSMVATAIAVPSFLAIQQVEQNKRTVAEYEAIIDQHQAETDRLLKVVEESKEEVSAKARQIQELESENQSLEGVRSTIIDNVGYYPSIYERSLVEKLVECEAGIESMEGKIAVVNVILNRIKSEKFPDTISEVIYQQNQFEPISSGVIYEKIPSEETKEAVKRAFLGERVVGSDVIYFWASWLDKSNSIWNHVDISTTIGVHHFGRSWN